MKGFLNPIFIIGLMLIVTFGFILAQEPCFDDVCEDKAWAYCESYCQDHGGCDEIVDMYAYCSEAPGEEGKCYMTYWIFCNDAPWWGKSHVSCFDYMCIAGK